MSHLSARMVGLSRLKARRTKFERQRIKSGAMHQVEFFHDPADPYSQILEHVLPEFVRRYDIELTTHQVGAPDDGAVPEREKLKAYSVRDAKLLAEKAGLKVKFKEIAPATHTDEADARREALGHYLGGMLYYGGEWYWGLDRLHYLEARLTELGVRHPDVSEAFIFDPPKTPLDKGKSNTQLHWYLSFRSPYTAIIVDRVKALADAYEAELKLRFVLPMVMRGLPIPPAKRRYILLDTAREAHRNGIPFDRIIDPVGRPVELGYSLLPWAIGKGCGFAYVKSWMSATWVEGIHLGSRGGLKKILERIGLDWAEARTILGNTDWRAEAEANRTEMMTLGIWGVPSFRVDDFIIWGQDRLWAVEDVLKARR